LDSQGGAPKATVEAMAALSGHGHEVLVLVLGQNKNSINENENHLILAKKNVLVSNFTSLRENIHGITNPSELFGALRQGRSFVPDIIVTSQIYTISTVLGWFLAKASHRPLVVVPHGSLTVYHESFGKTRKQFARKLLINKILKDSAAIFTASERESIEIPLQLKSKVRQVGLGAYFLDSYIGQSVPSLRSTQVLCLGRITPKKNFDLVIRALAILNAEFPSLELIIAGDGERSLITELKNLTFSLGLTQKVFFVGWVDSADKLDLFRSCFVNVLPSEEENFAITIGESLSCGLPCVVSRNVALSSLVEEASAGIVLEISNPETIAAAIKIILESDSLILFENSRKAGSELSWETVIPKWDAALVEFL